MENKTELNKGEMIVPVGDKFMVVSDDKMISEDRLMEVLFEQYTAIEDLVKSMEDKICYRVYNSVKVEMRRQLDNKVESLK